MNLATAKKKKPVFRLGKSFRAAYVAGLIVWAFTRPASAAISYGPAPTNKAEAEKRQQLLNEQAIISDQEKLRVGRERHERQMAEREKILAGMNSEFQARIQAVQIQAPAGSSAAAPEIVEKSWRPLLAGALVFVILGCFAFLIRQRAREA